MSRPPSTLTPRATSPSRARRERSTASVICAARAPSANVGRPSTRVGRAGADRPVRVGNERVEAVLVALRVAGRHGHVGGGRRVEVRRVTRATVSRWSARPTHSESGCSWSKRERRVGGGDLEAQLVLVAGRDLADRPPSRSTPRAVRNMHDGDVLGVDRARAARRARPATRRHGSPRRGPRARARAVTSSAHSAARRSPVTNSTRSHQCEPMSANARDAPARAPSTRQLSSSRVDSQSWR